MSLPTPWTSGSKPFTIGMRPIGLADWIEIDGHLAAHLAEKRRLEALDLAAVFQALAGTEAAQAEIQGALAAHLLRHFPQTYRRDGGRIAIMPAGRTVDLGSGAPPLLLASRLVQEDLCLMRRSAEGWRLVAAALAFPSSWRLADKIGRPMAEIHAPVPGFAGRMAAMVERIFDNLRPETLVERFNWSLYDDETLHHPEPRPRRWRRPDGALDLARVFLRIERQTLRLMPLSRDILFTIKVRHGPLAALFGTPEALALAGDLTGLDDPQRLYKGLAPDAGGLAAALAREPPRLPAQKTPS